jgi:hypothetical protein
MEENFEKVLSDQFENHTEQVDDQLVWEGIMERMEPKPKRRVIAWWTWSGLGLVSLLVFVGIVYSANSDIRKLTEASKSKETGTQNSEEFNLKQLVPIRVNQQDANNKKANTESLDSKSNTSNDQINNEIVFLKNTNTLQSSESTNELKRKISIELKQRNEYAALEGTIANGDPESRLNSNSRTSDVEDENNQSGLKQKKIIKKSKTDNLFAAIDPLILPFFLESKVTEVIGQPDVEVANVKSKLKYFHLFSSLGLYSSIDFGGASLISTALDSKYTDMISSNLTLMERVGLGFDIHILRYKGWSFSSGIGIEMLTDKFSWTGSYLEYRDGPYVESITEFIDGSRNEDVAFGPVPWELTKVINHYDDKYLITAPFMIGYEIRNGGHRFGINVGLDIKYQSGHTSLVLNELEIPTKFNLEGNWMSPSPRLTAGYGYFLNSNWSIGAELSVSRLQSNYAIDPSTSYIDYQMIGTRFSIRYDGL